MAHQPQQLVATAISTTEITLSWTDVDTLEGETYDIERDSVLIEEGWTSGTTYTDTGLDPDTEYTYRVRAVGGSEATAVTPSTVVTASVVLTPTIEIEAEEFSPTDIAGLSAWYDFSDISTLWQDTARTSAITTDAQAIKGVTDLSGNAKHLSEVTNGPAYKTGIQNGLSVARTDGTNDGLRVTGLTAPSGLTAIIAVGHNGALTANTETVLSLHSGGGMQILTTTSIHASGWDYYQNQIGGISANVAPTATTFGILVVRVNSTSSVDVYKDGGTPVNIDPENTVLSGSTVIYLGNNSGTQNYGAYNIGELARYDSTLSAADLNQVGPYFADRWGTTWTTVT